MTGTTQEWAVALEQRVLAGKYRLIRLLGAGGMGAVFEAEQPALGRRVAVKLVLPRKQASEQALQRFALEARAAARVAAGGVPQVLDFDHDAELGPFQVLDLLEGESLEARLSRGALTPAAAYAVVIEMLEVLGRVHAAGIVHRDIKPANVFLEQRPDGTRRVCILDFGVARVRDPLAAARVTAAGAVLGTLGFVPPEALAGRDVDHRADLYSVGVLLWSCLTGRQPFDRVHGAQALASAFGGAAPSLRSARPELSERLQRVYEWATATDPDARPASATALATELRRAQLDEAPAVLAGLPASHRPAPSSAPAAPGPTFVSGEQPPPAPRTPPPPSAFPMHALAPSYAPAPAFAPAPSTAPIARAPTWMPIALAVTLGALAATGIALVVVVRNEARSTTPPASPATDTPPLFTTTRARTIDASVPPTGPDPVLDTARRDVVHARTLLAAHHDDEALAAAERARQALVDAPLGSPRIATLAEAQIALGDVYVSQIPALAANVAGHGAPECIGATSRASDGATSAYTALMTDGRFDDEQQQCASQRLAHLFETLDTACPGEPAIHSGYVRTILTYYRRADRPGPCRAEASAGLARALAMDRALP